MEEYPKDPRRLSHRGSVSAPNRSSDTPSENGAAPAIQGLMERDGASNRASIRPPSPWSIRRPPNGRSRGSIRFPFSLSRLHPYNVGDGKLRWRNPAILA